MKKYFFILLIGVILLLPIFAQADFSGSADITFIGNIPESDGYESLLNPGNMLGIQDFAMMPSLMVKLDAGDESTSFSAWFSMKEYPVGIGLYSATSDFISTSEFIAAAGDKIYSFDLMRLSANVYLTDNISMEFGRQSMLTGYGYGWNPIDFANPLKNPADPDAEIRGVDAISLRSYLGSSTAIKIYALVPEESLVAGLDYEEIKVGTEAVFYLPGLELRVAGLWDYDYTEGSDAYTPSAGAALMLDIFGIGVYGEAAARKGSRNYFPDGSAELYRKTDWLLSGMVGLEYTFSSELYGVVEYFYNGEGLDGDERLLFETTLTAMGGIPSIDLLNIYSPGYFAEHYILINLMQPFYDFDTVFNLSALYSPDSAALTIMPSLDYSFSGNFSVNISYTGLFDFSENDFNEITALPVRHVISSVFTYSY